MFNENTVLIKSFKELNIQKNPLNVVCVENHYVEVPS